MPTTSLTVALSQITNSLATPLEKAARHYIYFETIICPTKRHSKTLSLLLYRLESGKQHTRKAIIGQSKSSCDKVGRKRNTFDSGDQKVSADAWTNTEATFCILKAKRV